jgi:hypothetical protein
MYLLFSLDEECNSSKALQQLNKQPSRELSLGVAFGRAIRCKYSFAIAAFRVFHFYPNANCHKKRSQECSQTVHKRLLVNTYETNFEAFHHFMNYTNRGLTRKNEVF